MCGGPEGPEGREAARRGRRVVEMDGNEFERWWVQVDLNEDRVMCMHG